MPTVGLSTTIGADHVPPCPRNELSPGRCARRAILPPSERGGLQRNRVTPPRGFSPREGVTCPASPAKSLRGNLRLRRIRSRIALVAWIALITLVPLLACGSRITLTPRIPRRAGVPLITLRPWSAGRASRARCALLHSGITRLDAHHQCDRDRHHHQRFQSSPHQFVPPDRVTYLRKLYAKDSSLNHWLLGLRLRGGSASS